MARLSLGMLAAFILVTPIACTLWSSDAPSPERDPNDADDLTGVRWTLVRVETPDDVLVPTPSERSAYWVTFDDAGTVTARNACNACTGTFTHADADVSGERGIDVDLSCQEMACGPGQPFLGHGRILREATTYRVDGDTLRMTTAYRLRKTPSTDEAGRTVAVYKNKQGSKIND